MEKNELQNSDVLEKCDSLVNMNVGNVAKRTTERTHIRRSHIVQRNKLIYEYEKDK